MKVRIPALLAAVTLIAVACGGTTASPSASTAASVAPPPSTAASEAPSTAPSAAAGPTTLRVSRISDFLPSIHPVELGTGNQELMADIVFSTLVDVDKDEVTILPDLAETWEVIPDATTYTFHLNPAAVWSDGKPVTADDVEWTIAWSAQNPDAFKQIPVRHVPQRQGRRRGQGDHEHPRGHQEDRRPHTSSSRSTAPDSTFLRRIAGAVYYILPKHILDGLTAAQAETCPFCLGTVGETIGSGPYDFSESISAAGATLQGEEELLEGQGLADRQPRLQDPGVERVRRASSPPGELDLASASRRPRARASPACRASSS